MEKIIGGSKSAILHLLVLILSLRRDLLSCLNLALGDTKHADFNVTLQSSKAKAKLVQAWTDSWGS